MNSGRLFFMIKLLAATAIATLSLSMSLSAFAADTNGEVWTGHFTDVMANRSGVTDEFCKKHVPDTYKTNASNVMKEITGDNGVVARDLGYRVRGIGGVYFVDGTAEFTVTVDGKKYKDKAHYFGQMLQRERSAQRGIWFSKDCKGFYAVGPNE